MPSMNVSLTSELIDADAELLNQVKLTTLKAALADGVRQAKDGDSEPFGLNELIAELNGRA